MSRPAARMNLEPVLPNRGKVDNHPGLLLQRYLARWATGQDGDPEEKRILLNAAIEAISKNETRDLYRAAYERWIRSLPAKTVSCKLQTLKRLIVGLGSENVLETGITLHHTYGMPWIPGSAVKGLAAHYCHQVWGEVNHRFKKPTEAVDSAYRAFLDGKLPQPDDNYYRLIFGNTDDAGCVTFHDAWFVPESDARPLKLDVMTPHHPRWIEGETPPTDFDSPNPVPFLSVSGKFFFALSWNGPPSDQSAAWLDLSLLLVREALFDWGIGGKTNSGYGLFDRAAWTKEESEQQKKREQERREAERQAQLAAMTDEERLIHEFLENHRNKSERREWIKLLEELKKPTGRFQDRRLRRCVAERVKQGMEAEKRWNDKHENVDRKKFIEAILNEEP